MTHCCNDNADELLLRTRQGRLLYIVLAVNATMFLVEFTAGWLAGSTALLADSLDMFGDAAVYAVTLYALAASSRARAGVALFKGALMALFGCVVLIEAAHKTMAGTAPDVGLMTAIGIAALLANALCFVLLYRHRVDDLNMRSAWLCSRNDLIGNLGVLVAAVAVYLTGSALPDVLIGVAIAVLFLLSARQVLREAWTDWRRAGPGAR